MAFKWRIFLQNKRTKLTGNQFASKKQQPPQASSWLHILRLLSSLILMMPASFLLSKLTHTHSKVYGDLLNGVAAGVIVSLVELLLDSGHLPSTTSSKSLHVAQIFLFLIPKRNREHIIGDLEEEYCTTHKHFMRLWYWGQVIALIARYWWAAARRLAGLEVILKLIRK